MQNINGPAISPGESLQALDDFFGQIDDDHLFDAKSENHHRRLRNRLAAALNTLLLWQRPFLVAERGIDWPYAELAKRRDRLAAVADAKTAGIAKAQASLYLALLPFPGQWAWLNGIQAKLGNHPEITQFLANEQENIRHKLSKKRQKAFRLNNFCQVLKRPRLPLEKGVLRIFSILHAFADMNLLRALNRSYVLYLEPPWGVVYRNSWLRSFAQLDDPCLIGLGGLEDRNFIESQSGLWTTSLAHGDFLPDAVSGAERPPKQFDIVFNATYDDMPRKRHRFLLELLQHPLLSDNTVLAMGTGQTVNVERFSGWVSELGLRGRVETTANLLRHTVPENLARCRIAVHLALNENVCRVVYEFFRADLPCVISAATAGMDFSVFNPQTGAVANDDGLAQTIRRVLDERHRFSPRRWFIAQSGSRNNTAKLNECLRELFRQCGYKWRDDIVALNSGGPDRYTDPADAHRFVSEYEDLYDLFKRRNPLPVKLVRG